MGFPHLGLLQELRQHEGHRRRVALTFPHAFPG
jgi:hypothetical protein